jgi:hypothetical protein
MTVGSATALAIDRIVTPVAKMHRNISGRWFSAVGPLGRPIRPAHDAVSTTVYESIRLGGYLAGLAIDRATNDRPALNARTQAVANGLWGDRLGHLRGRLEIPIGLRDADGASISLDNLATAFPDATPHLVLLAHGFADTERSWLPDEDAPGLFSAIVAAQPAMTPVMIRYNSGRSVADNGALLADLLDRIHSHWPTAIESISMVGHSMGGLIIRHACAAGTVAEHDWVAATTNVVSLGSPHLGTPIEKAVHGLAAGLGIARNTIPLQEFVDTRSRGIKDLRSGSPVVLPDAIRQHFVAGVFTNDPSHPMGVLFGDLVVRVRSASGGSDIEAEHLTVVNGVRHNRIARNEAVVDRILSWLQPPGHA